MSQTLSSLTATLSRKPQQSALTALTGPPLAAAWQSRVPMPALSHPAVLISSTACGSCCLATKGESYLGTMAAHPLLTKEVTGILGAFLGDLLAQGLPAVTPSLQQARQRWAGAPAIPTPLPAVAFRYDVWRALRMVGFGALVGTPVNHLWFTALDTTILPEDPTSTLAVVAKMGLDQTLMAPLMTSAFFSTITALEGRPEQIMDVLQAKLRPTLAANYCLWPAAHLVNFGLVPSDQRILRACSKRNMHGPPVALGDEGTVALAGRASDTSAVGLTPPGLPPIQTPYAHRALIPGAPSIHAIPDPPGYEAHHIWLLARHGTRWPTLQRMQQINSVASTLQDARNTSAFPWIHDWRSPVASMADAGGELHDIGEEELWSLGQRWRRRFPALASRPYLPKHFPIISTQVPRAAASASAFAAGFFPDRLRFNKMESAASNAGSTAQAGSSELDNLVMGMTPRQVLACCHTLEVARVTVMCFRFASREVPAELAAVRCWRAPQGGLQQALRPRSVALTMAPKKADPLLRPFEMCSAYAQHEEYVEKWLGGWMAEQWQGMTADLEEKLQMNRRMRACEVEALWQLCLFEAGLEDDTSRACALFQPEQVSVITVEPGASGQAHAASQTTSLAELFWWSLAHAGMRLEQCRRGACGSMQVELLEWLDDVDLLESHSWGARINYAIAGPLLAHMRSALQSAADSKHIKKPAHLLFAHCETLVPLATLLGLFKPELALPPSAAHPPNSSALAVVAPEAEARRLLSRADVVSDIGLQLRPQAALPSGPAPQSCHKTGQPPSGLQPPGGWYPCTPFNATRLFKGSRVSPYAANLAVVLYRAVGGVHGRASDHTVRLVYNEQVVPIPGCGDGEGGLDCNLDQFLAITAAQADEGVLNVSC
ncbi:hypothetical protein QJQ45_023746 [Haematococcus lacustris]|nr:hypothetical protein QJQ45_023746 [Haematococcus lacustris]